MAVKLDYKVIVGLEIHVHLATKTKMFCGCELSYGGTPNSRVCPVCTGMPGSLPVMNKLAYEFSVLTAMALNCQIARFTKWDRKSYYYPDLPKNYQISQYDLPLSQNGFIEIPLEDGSVKRVGIIRAHLEEDAGKNSHELGNFSAIDLNRAGSPLLEIVTAPDMNSAAEVRQMAQELQRIVRYLGISEADMQKGHMRFEPNVNLHIFKDGQTYKTPICEIKNLNSFRAIERSVTFEIQRQLEEFRETGKTLQMGNKRTYGWDDDNQTTVLQRVKEEAHDYRYFPEPDLAPVELDEVGFERIKAQLGELPLQKQKRFVSQYGLSDYDAAVLTGDKAMAEYFDAVVTAGAEPKRACNLITQTGQKLANVNNTTVDHLGIAPTHLAKLAQMTEKGLVSATSASQIYEKMAGNGTDPEELAKQANLIQTSDTGTIEALVNQVLADNVEAVQDVVSKSKKAQKAQGFLTGQVLKMSKGQANPKVVSEILLKKLAELSA
jgi:aspartyl-tRNA(Asn)/glutamyl-tRNA(Gln) amidotransferase subunit B